MYLKFVSNMSPAKSSPPWVLALAPRKHISHQESFPFLFSEVAGEVEGSFSLTSKKTFFFREESELTWGWSGSSRSPGEVLYLVNLVLKKIRLVRISLNVVYGFSVLPILQ